MADDFDAPAADAAPDEDAAKPPLILAVWLSGSARVRLAESGEFEITDDAEQIDATDLLAVSTRLPKGQSPSIVADFRVAADRPIVAIAHAGGEDLAVEMLVRGASGLVAEVNEEAIQGYLAGAGHNERRVDTFERSVARRNRTHCARGAELLRTSAGEEVAAMVRSHHEHWDGTGYPDELEGEAIPLGARIVAVADALDPVADRADGAAPSPQALAAVQEASGTAFDPDVVKAALEAFG